MKKRWVVLNVLCIGIVCMMMTSCTGIFQQKKLESSGQCGDQLNWTYDQKKENINNFWQWCNECTKVLLE